MENYVLGTRAVLEDGKNGGHGATYIGGIQRHRDMDGAIEAEMLFVRIGVLEVVSNGGAIWGIVKLGGFSEIRGIGGRGDGEEEEGDDKRGGHGGPAKGKSGNLVMGNGI